MSPTVLYERQNRPEARTLARAFRRRYTVARRWRLLRLEIGILLATLGVVLALTEPTAGEYVAALATAWVVLGRTVMEASEHRQRKRGALAQEEFDTDVLGLPWSSATVGNHPLPEDLRNWGRRQTEEGLLNWYSDTRPARHPVDALICQRATITWARQDHAVYAQTLRWTAGVILALTLVLGVALDLELGEYLLRLGLPMLPAVLDILDIAKSNAQVAQAKTRLEGQATALLTRAQETGQPPSVAECRQLQDGIYATRLLPSVPQWLYHRTRSGRQHNMDEVVGEQVQALPAGLR